MSFTQYLKETRAELEHVRWPGKRQTLIYTALVVFFSLFTGAYLGLFDRIFTSLLEYFIK